MRTVFKVFGLSTFVTLWLTGSFSLLLLPSTTREYCTSYRYCKIEIQSVVSTERKSLSQNRKVEKSLS